MQLSSIRQQRRPFLAPLWVLTAIVAMFLVAVVGWIRSAATTTVIVVAAAERQLGTITDAPLSAQGEEEAQRLARAFGDPLAAGIGTLAVTPERYVQQTAAPLASRLGREPVVIALDDARRLAAHLLREHRGGTALVVVPAERLEPLVHALVPGIETSAARAGEAGRLYVVTLPTYGPAKVLRLHY